MSDCYLARGEAVSLSAKRTLVLGSAIACGNKDEGAVVRDGIAHIPKPQHPDRFESWCGLSIAGFALTGLDHASACVITGCYVQPCPDCVREAVAVLTGAGKYEPAKNPRPEYNG